MLALAPENSALPEKKRGVTQTELSLLSIRAYVSINVSHIKTFAEHECIFL